MVDALKIRRVHGWDLSLTHGGLVELTDGEVTGFWYYTDRVASAERSKRWGYRVPKFKDPDFLARGLARLVWIEGLLGDVLVTRKPDLVVAEDYAYGAEQGAHQLGELGGQVRLLCWDANLPLRLHSPGALKMYGADNGNANKAAVVAAVKAKWGHDWAQFNQPWKIGAKEHDTSIGEDLADAFVLAEMGSKEAMIRAGVFKLSDLGTDKQRQSFLRTTPTYPLNVLGREWILRSNTPADLVAHEPIDESCRPTPKELGHLGMQ